MKVFKFSLITIIFLSFIIVPDILESRTVWDAGAGSHWTTPNGGASEDGIPRENSHQTATGGVSCGGCDPALGTCWELDGDGRYLIIYDLFVSGGEPDPTHGFLPVSN